MFKGSTWHRWDPHIHAPGTALNDQFGGDDSWDDYLKKIEKSDPQIRALGVTDYAGLDLYEKVRAQKTKGRLPDVGLIFPNVELRLATGTGKDTAINLHLLISPEDLDHVDRARGFLRGLTFERKDEQYRCERADFIRLGKAHDASIRDDQFALKTGITQFKVNFDLDPRSVYVELVEHFRQVKLRRQIIIVTHNANLVVNTDADQVIVAAVAPHEPGKLPTMTYVAGGLEDPNIRQAVCEILEGGEVAFQERARRLRLKI